MSIGTAWATAELRRLLGSGCMVAFHDRDPGRVGQSGLLAGPFRVAPGAFTVNNGAATLARGLELGQAQRGGRASHVSLWTRDRRFIAGSRLRVAVALERGVTVTVERRNLTVRFGA